MIRTTLVKAHKKKKNKENYIPNIKGLVLLVSDKIFNILSRVASGNVCSKRLIEQCHIKGWAQDWRKSDGCFSANLISSPWRRYEDYNISFCKQWKFRCHCSYEQWHLNLHCYAPNFKEVGGAYCFWVVRPSVRPSVLPSVRPSVRHAFWCIA